MFEAGATGGNPPYTYEWSSNIQGNLGSGAILNIDSSSLSSGPHIIKVVTRDSQSRIDDDQIGIGICDVPTPGIPEFPTVALPVISVIALMFFVHRKKQN